MITGIFWKVRKIEHVSVKTGLDLSKTIKAKTLTKT